MNLKASVVVIPIYKAEINKNEQQSLLQCFKVLGEHPIVFVKPETLDMSAYFPYIGNRDFGVESFDPGFFANIRGYNRLMLSQLFYRRFLSYHYMLIYQLDAFVFRDELLFWCEQGYDYIGAPWVNRPKLTRQIRSYFYRRFNKKQKNSISPEWLQFHNQVGNGGFSLRNVKKHYDICGSHQEMIKFYNRHSYNHFFNEDVFWSIEVNRKRKVLNIPGYRKALQFSIEQKPDLALSILNQKLPFGVHAWHMYPEVWQPVMESDIRSNKRIHKNSVQYHVEHETL